MRRPCRRTCIRDPHWFSRQRDSVFASSWQFVGDVSEIPDAGCASPVTLLPGAIDEPLLLTRDDDGVEHCLSNVCTHRGAIVVDEPTRGSTLACPYHGRTFTLDGRMKHMPCFEEAEGFPSERDHLPRLPLERWGPLRFTSLAPARSFADWIGEVDARLGALPVDRLEPDPAGRRTYEVEANWALYVDNYLEGFHVPYVHPGLAESIDARDYPTETFEQVNLQIGIARAADDAIPLPDGHADAGRGVAGYYFWLFPTTMLNFYPWGLSLNVVEPLAPERTRIRFLPYVWDASRREGGAGGDLDTVELEDEAIVRSVQCGVRSRLYDRGRYSPTMERCVHHFHRLLAATLTESN